MRIWLVLLPIAILTGVVSLILPDDREELSFKDMERNQLFTDQLDHFLAAVAGQESPREHCTRNLAEIGADGTRSGRRLGRSAREHKRSNNCGSRGAH